MMASAAQRPSPRALIALVQSINPNTTKASRMDDPRRAKEKDEMLEDLVELARRTLASHHSPKQIYDAERVIDRIKRRLSRMPGGRSSVQDFDALLQRLDRLPHPPADLPAVFSLLSHLSFSAPSTSGPIPAPPSRQSIHPSSPVDDPRKRTTSTGSSASLARHDHLAASRRTAVDHVRRNVESRASSVAGSLDGRSATPNIEQRFASIDINRRAAAAETAAKVQEADIGRQRAERNTERIDRERTEEAQGQADPAPVPAQTSPPVGTEPPKIDPKDLGLGTVPKAVVLQRWRDAVKRPLLPERELLRDILYLVQGINGHHVRFEKVAAQASTNDPGVIRTTADDERDAIIKVKIVEDGTGRIPLPVRHLIHRLAEAGKHYQRITSFTRSQATKEQTGRIMQSLCHFLDREIEEFYELICYLEALFDAGPAPAETPLTATTPVRSVIPLPPADRNRGLTLKRVLVLVEPSLLRMRLMSSLVEGAQHTHGGALVSLIHNYTFNGDPLVRELTEKLLEEVSKSFFDSLSRWIFEGELYDPFREFFIELNPEAHAATGQQGVVGLAYTSPLGEVDAASLWENKFTLRTELVPAFLSEGFARKIFSSGKSLNFIRHSCGVSDWQEARGAILQTTANSFARPSVDANSLPALQYRDLTGLERTIDTVHSTVSKRLLDIFLDKLKLREHLRAINDYLLLTRGDFADVLMESLSPILHKQASTLYRHSLSGALETAIRGSNAQFDDADILRRLDARVLEFSGNETGWDTFTLEYRVDSPVNTVLDASAMAEYQQVFQHLWRMKRVEGSLSNSCVNLMGASNALSKATFDGVRGKERRSVEKDEDIEALRHEAHRSLLVLSSMTHFMRQLQGYNQLEVILYSWQDLEAFFEKRHGDLDVLIAAHRSYLNSLHGKVMLRGRGAGSKQRGTVDYLASELRANIESVLRFSDAVEQLATFILDFLQRRELLRPASKYRGSGDEDDDDGDARRSEDEDAATTRRLSAVLRSLSDASADFKERTDGIISRLERHGNLVIRDLSVRLDFNGFYNRVRPAATPARTI